MLGTLNAYILNLPPGVIVQIGSMVVTIIVFFYGTGIITRKLSERKVNLENQHKADLERQIMLSSIKSIEKDIEEIRVDDGKRDACMEDIKEQIQKIRLIIASHLKVPVD